MLLVVSCLLLVVGLSRGEDPLLGQCLCIQGTNVNIRDAPCGNVVGQASTGECFEAAVGAVSTCPVTCTLNGNSYTWCEFYYYIYGSSDTAWVANTLLNINNSVICAGCMGVRIVSRRQWGARSPTSTTSISPTSQYFIHHTVGSFCFDEVACSAAVRSTQNYHMDTNGWSDIGYSFLIGEDGNVYEGRGWEIQGAHTFGWNSKAHGIAYMGDFTNRAPNQAALDAGQNLIQCGVQLGHSFTPYKVSGHKDVVSTACPGNSLYPVIQGWPYYNSNPSNP